MDSNPEPCFASVLPEAVTEGVEITMSPAFSTTFGEVVGARTSACASARPPSPDRATVPSPASDSDFAWAMPGIAMAAAPLTVAASIKVGSISAAAPQTIQFPAMPHPAPESPAHVMSRGERANPNCVAPFSRTTDPASMSVLAWLESARTCRMPEPRFTTVASAPKSWFT